MRFSAGIMQGMGRGFAGARRMLRPGQYARNLLILHTATHQDSADWVTVKQKIETRAPDIDVRVGSNDQPSPELCRWQVTRPSLVFSPFRLIAYRPPGGTIYAGREIGKIAEWRRMVDSGLPVPQTVRLVPDLCLKPEALGRLCHREAGQGHARQTRPACARRRNRPVVHGIDQWRARPHARPEIYRSCRRTKLPHLLSSHHDVRRADIGGQAKLGRSSAAAC